MFECFRIQNYRVFKDIEISGLCRINLFGGKNNTGKTSMLEAISLLVGAGDPRWLMSTNVIRGLDPGSTIVPQSVETLWQQLFYHLDTSKPIEIEGHHASHGLLSLKITWERPQTTQLTFDTAGRPSEADLVSGRSLIFQYSGPGGVQGEGRVRLNEQGLEIQQPSIDVPFLGAILTSRTGSNQEDATRLGQLRIKKHGQILLEALQTIEPRLQSIEDNAASGTPMIWGDIGLSELVPLSTMGEGMTRIARLVLAIATASEGVVLVDEIENGLHYSVQPKVWKAIDKAAQQFDTQILATTHNFECLQSAYKALGPQGFRYHRLSARLKNRRGEDIPNRFVTYEPGTIDVAIRHHLEVR